MPAITHLEAEYDRLTGGCGLLDRSERGKLALSGADAKTFLQGQVSNDVESLKPGHGCYAAFLTPKGKMLGDLRVLDADEELLLDTERLALQELFNLIRRFSIGYDVQLHKRTLERGLLSLIGPQADQVADLRDVHLPREEHAHAAIELAGIPARAIRTDTGLDLLVEADRTEALRDALAERGAVEVSAAAADVVRIEHGRPRYGIDLDDTVIPQEAGLNERAVSFTKGCYVGQETVARLFYRGKPNRQLRGLRADAPLTPGTELTYEGRTAVRVTSAAVSPVRGPIALAFVRREVPLGARVHGEPADPESGVSADAGVSAEVVELPFA